MRGTDGHAGRRRRWTGSRRASGNSVRWSRASRMPSPFPRAVLLALPALLLSGVLRQAGGDVRLPPGGSRARPTQQYRFQNRIELAILFASPHSPDGHPEPGLGRPQTTLPDADHPIADRPSNATVPIAKPRRTSYPSTIAHGSWIDYITIEG